MDRNQVYNDVHERLKASEKDLRKIISVRKYLEEILIEEFNQTNSSFSRLRYIGSTETGHVLKWIRDIDCVLAFSPFNKDKFRDGLSNLSGTLKNLKFRQNVGIVQDIATADLFGEHIGIIGINDGLNKYDSLEADVWNHPEFSKSHLTRDQARDVRLAKIFFRALGIPKKSYGGGFSVEQLISHYKSFESLLETLSEGNPIYIDFSRRFTGELSPMVITYPFCGLDNLSRRLTPEEISKISRYAKVVLGEPMKFFEDALGKFNRELWSTRYKEMGESEKYSSPDIFLTRKENRILNKILKSKKPRKILDIGCANGYSTLEYTEGLETMVVGVDLNIEAIKNSGNNLILGEQTNIKLLGGNAENLPFSDESFDFVIMKRVLGNLPSRNFQERAIEEASRVLSRGGYLYILDGITESLESLSKIRREKGLPPLTQPNHTYLPSESEITQMAKDTFELESIRNPASSYYYITRFLYPLVYKTFGKDPLNMKFDSFLHKIAARCPNFGEIGVCKEYLLRKK